MDKRECLFVGILIGIAIVVCALIAVFGLGKVDGVNVERLGQRMCQTYSLEYDHREYFQNGDYQDLVIYCKKSGTKELVDGILVQII